MLERLVQDLRYAARLLWRSPGFTAIAVFTLALGIGANTAIFSIVDALLFRPLPISKPNEVVRLFGGETRHSAGWGFTSFPAYQRYRDQAGTFTGLAACIDRFPANVTVGKFGAERINAGMVTANYFEVLGVKAELGRSLIAADDNPAASPVVMLGHAFWKAHFPPDVDAIGSQALVNGRWFTVVGVAPPDFGGVAFNNFPQVWIPLTQAIQVDPLLKSQIPLNHENWVPFYVVGRLKPGFSIVQAQEQLDVIAANMGAGKLDSSEGEGWTRPWPALVPATQAARKDNAQLSLMLLGIVMVVLLIACADVAGLMLARSETRQKEIAVRLALGAPRGRIISLHLAEGLLVSLLGAVPGCALAALGTRLIVLSAPPQMPLPLDRASSILDWRVLAFTALTAIVAGVLSTLAPAFKYSRGTLALGIKSDSTRSSVVSRKFSVQGLLVVLQVAASVVLLVAAGLLTRTMWNAAQISLGFHPEHTVAASTDLIRQGYDKDKAAQLLDPLLASLRAQPGVQSAALGPLPLQPNVATMVRIEGHNSAKKEWIQLDRVSPGYMNTLGIPFIGGRDFKDSDTAAAPGVAIISQAMAQKYWPHESALGKHISEAGIHDQSFEIVGIVGNTAGYDLRRDLQAVVYLPLDQTYLMFPWQPDITLLARAPEDSRSLVNAIRTAVANVDSTVPLFRIRTVEEQVATTMGTERFLAKILLTFAMLALVLAAGGVFGLMSYATARGSHEFGVRMALGAQRYHVLWMVLRKGLVLASLGLAIGLGGALWLTRLLMSLLFGVSRTDAFTFTGVGLIIVLVALLACYLPAHRATQVDPMIALRNE